MRRAIVLVVAVVIVAGVLAVALHQRAATRGIVITVTDASTGAPVEGASFALLRPDGRMYAKHVTSGRFEDRSEPVRSGDRVVVLAWGYELRWADLSGPGTFAVELEPCSQFFDVSVEESLSDGEGLRLSLVQSLRDPPERMLVAAKLEHVFRTGETELRVPVPGHGVAVKGLAMHNGGLVSYPLGFWAQPEGRVDIRHLRSRDVVVSAHGPDGKRLPIEHCIVAADFASQSPPAAAEADAIRALNLTTRYPVSYERGVVRVRDLPLAPMHCLCFAGGGWSHGSIASSASDVRIEVGGPHYVSMGPPRMDGGACPKDAVVLPGHLDLEIIDYLQGEGLLEAVAARPEALAPSGKKTHLRVGAPFTIWSPTRGLAYGTAKASALLSANTSPGRITVQVDPERGSQRFAVTLLPMWFGRGMVRPSRGLDHHIAWPLNGAAETVIRGLPLSQYRVIVHDVLGGQGQAASGTQAAVTVRLSSESPEVLLTVGDAGVTIKQ